MLLEIKEKNCKPFFEHVMQNNLMFHFYDKIPSLLSSNSKYQLTYVINKKNLIQMST